MASPRTGLPALAEALWRSFAAGAIGEDDTQSLAELIEARKIVPTAAPSTPRRTGSRPRTSASVARRRQWTSSGWLPPAIASRFTMAEAAVLAVILAEVAVKVRCELAVSAIAAKAGVCVTTAKRALRTARAMGLVSVEERRVSWCRNLPNAIRVTSPELTAWLRMRAGSFVQGVGAI